MRPKPDFPWLLENGLREILTDVLTAPRAYARTRLAELESDVSPTDPTAANLYGVTLGALGRFEEAVSVLRAALVAHPRYFFARVNVAHCYFELASSIARFRS